MAARSTPSRNAQHRPAVAAGLQMQVVGVEVVMHQRLTTWMVLAGGIAVVASAFFASAGITHWVMSLRHTVVVVRPGPTVYLPRPAGHGHSHDRVAPAPAPAVPAYDGGLPLRQDTGARPDHRGAHARGHRRGAHARRHRGGAHAWAHRRGAHTWPDHGKWHHKNQGQAQHIIAAEAMATITVSETRPGERASYPLDRNRLVH